MFIRYFLSGKNFAKKFSSSSVQRCCIKKVLVKVSQILQGNTCARVWHKCFSVKLTKFLRTIFLYRTPQVTASVGVEFFINFFPDLRMSLGLLGYIDLLSSVYNSNIV